MIRLLILLTFYFLLFTFPHPVYAGHCATGQTSYTGYLRSYCAGNARYQDLSDCEHLPLENCPAGTYCEEEKNITDPTQSFIARCVPGTAPAGTSANDAAGLKQIEDVFKNVISTVVGLAFIVSLVMLVFAGIKYLTSSGEPKAIQAAHLTVTWALLGILFMAIAWLILQLIENFTGVQVTIFDIKALNP